MIFGLAYSDPEFALISVDTSKFRVYVHRKGNSLPVEAFLRRKSKLKNVLFVHGVRNLIKLPLSEFHSVVVFDDPEILFSVNDIRVLDSDPYDTSRNIYPFRRLLDRNFSSYLEEGTTDVSISDSSLSLVRDRVNSIRFKFLIENLPLNEKIRESFILNTCKFCVRSISKAEWVVSARDRALKAGVDPERLAEIEKFLVITPDSDSLWRAYYDVVELGRDLDESVKSYLCNKFDLEFLFEILGNEKGKLEYKEVPSNSKSVRDKIARKKKVKQPKKTHKSEDYNY